MPTQEIKETNWQLFCERFEKELKGTLITLNVVKHDGSSEVIGHGLPLQEFRFEKTNGCSDRIHVQLGNVQHQIIDPIHVRLRGAPETQKQLQIDAESGSVEVRFSSARAGALLEGL